MIPSRSSHLIFHVLDHCLPELSGYTVRSHNLLRALQTAGYSVVGIASTSRETRVVEDEVDGVRYVRLPFRLEGAPQTAGRLWRRVVGYSGWLAAEVRRRRVALIHAHSPVLSALPALWAARRRRVPMVYEVRGFWEDTALERRPDATPDLRYHLSRTLETFALRRADAVTTISLALRDEIVRRGIPLERVHVAANGVDSTAFRPQVPDSALLARHQLEGRFVVGFLGYFHDYEGVDVLLHGFARMLTEIPHATLLLVGTGAGETALRTEAHRLGIAAHVIFAGEVPHAEIPRYYSICDVVVYPRISNRTTELTTPLKPLEAMAMGKPVIASRVGGLREIVRDGDTGVLYPAEDTKRLGDALFSLAVNPTRRGQLGANARRFVCEQRTWEHAVEAYARVYAQLLGGTT